MHTGALSTLECISHGSPFFEGRRFTEANPFPSLRRDVEQSELPIVSTSRRMDVSKPSEPITKSIPFGLPKIRYEGRQPWSIQSET